jgi:leader peptidase (prepilin peptidase)/N-methyltransferase
VTNVLAGAFGFLGALIAHDLAAQVLGDLPLRPLTGTCPGCGKTRGWGRLTCPHCGRRIGRELIVVALGVGFALSFANALGPVWALVAYLGFLPLTLALGITDVDALRIVDRLNLRGTIVVVAALGLGALADGSGAAFLRAILGGAAYFVGTNLVFLLVGGRGFGYGDVKLSVQLGVFTAYLSWGTLGWGVFLTALIGGVLSLLVVLGAALKRMLARGRDLETPEPSIREAMKVELPYGPSMILGSWIAITLAGLGAFPIPT